MKTILILAAVLVLSASAAAAECAYHKQVNAEAQVDRTVTTASVTPDEQKAEDVVLLKKADGAPADAAATE